MGHARRPSCYTAIEQFVVACGDSSKVLEFVEEALDEIALTVEGKITSPRRLAVGFRRNHGGDFALGERIEQRVAAPKNQEIKFFKMCRWDGHFCDF